MEYIQQRNERSTCNNTNESPKHHVKRKKPDAKENDCTYIKYKTQQLSTKLLNS